MKKLGFLYPPSWRLLLPAVFLFLLLPSASASPEELRLYIWYDYIPPEIISGFESRFNCKVVVSSYRTNEEMIARLRTGGVSQYDVVVPSCFVVKSMRSQALLRKLDQSLIPNLKNVDAKFRKMEYDTRDEYSVPYQWGTVGVMYRKDKLKDFTPSWDVIFSGNAPGPFLLLDSMREMMGSALVHKRRSPNSASIGDINLAVDLLVKAKKDRNFVGFENGPDVTAKLLSGAAHLAVVYNGDAIKAAENADIGFFNPSEGVIAWVDTMAIPSKAPNPVLANKFINHILEPDVGAALSKFNRFATPNRESLALVDKADLANPAIYPGDKLKLYFLNDLGNANNLCNEAWNAVKNR